MREGRVSPIACPAPLDLEPDQLGEHFWIQEASVSRTYPSLVRPLPDWLRPRAEQLAQTCLDPVRRRVGGPVTVTSWYRPKALNQKLKGSATSQHLLAEAADITFGDVRVIFEQLLEGELVIPSGQIIYYPDRHFLHVALPGARYPGTSLHLHWPGGGYEYARVGSVEQLRHMMA